MSPWDWFVEKFNADPAGWIALFLAVIAAVIASVWWKRIVRWAKAIPGRYRAYMTRKYGALPPAPPPIQSTVAVSFYQAIDDDERSMTDQIGRRRGGTIQYELRNHGPAPVGDLRLELLSPELQAESSLYVGALAANEFRFVTIRIPFSADRNAALLWAQEATTFRREIILPLK